MTLSKSEYSASAQMTSEILDSDVQGGDLIINYPNHFIDYDLSKRQRYLLVGSVFVTALLVTYFTEIRPNFKKTCFYWSVMLNTADYTWHALKMLFSWIVL